MTTVIILIILACALPETSASIVSASRPCPLAVTVTQVLRRDVMVLMVMMVMMVLMVMVVMGLKKCCQDIACFLLFILRECCSRRLIVLLRKGGG